MFTTTQTEMAPESENAEENDIDEDESDEDPDAWARGSVPKEPKSPQF